MEDCQNNYDFIQTCREVTLEEWHAEALVLPAEALVLPAEALVLPAEAVVLPVGGIASTYRSFGSARIC